MRTNKIYVIYRKSAFQYRLATEIEANKIHHQGIIAKFGATSKRVARTAFEDFFANEFFGNNLCAENHDFAKYSLEELVDMQNSIRQEISVKMAKE